MKKDATSDRLSEFRANSKYSRRNRLSSVSAQSAPNAIVVSDIDGIVTYWDKHAEVLYQWTEQEGLGKPTSELILLPGHEAVSDDLPHSQPDPFPPREQSRDGNAGL